MNKKAFTIVEQAIVLIVIGLIVAAIIKSLSMMDTAKVQRDIANLDILKGGLMQYYASNKVLPPLSTQYNCENCLDANELIKQGTVTDRNFTTELSGGGWNLVYCSPDYVDDNETFYTEDSAGEYVCVRHSLSEPAVNGRLVCTMDKREDSDLRYGYVRVHSGTAVIDAADYENCLNIDESFDLMYRIY